MACGQAADAETDRYVSGVFSVVDPMDHRAGALRPHAHEPATAMKPRWLFKVVDVVSGSTLVEDANANATVATLASVESMFDVSIYVWIPDLALWRQLTPGEHRILWDFRGR
jgi:hypothetical protein